MSQQGQQTTYKDGEPCRHPGCLHHLSHPCEGCGRLGARDEISISMAKLFLSIGKLNYEYQVSYPLNKIIQEII